MIHFVSLCTVKAVARRGGGLGVPQFLADQLTLSQPDVANAILVDRFYFINYEALSCSNYTLCNFVVIHFLQHDAKMYIYN